MSGKNSQSKLANKNHFMDAYQRCYLAGNRLDLSAIDLERLEALLFGVAHAHDLIGRQVQDLASVVGVLAAENAALQRKLASALRKSVRPGPASRAIDEDEGFHLCKREEPPSDEMLYQPVQSKKTKGQPFDRRLPEPQLRLSEDWLVEDKHPTHYVLAEPPVPQMKHSAMSLASTKDSALKPSAMTAHSCTPESDNAIENSDVSDMNKKTSITKVDNNGLITPLMGNGLKKTFVRCRNNMFTILEEPKDNSNPSALSSIMRNPLDSPKKQVNIEQLRLGFSADSRTLFAFKRDDPCESFGKLENLRLNRPQQPNVGFTLSSRFLDEDPEFLL